MRHLAFAISLAITPTASLADPILNTDWQLLAIDGTLVAASVTASMQIAADGQITGNAPCNSFGAQNMGQLPAFSLGPIRATRMACDNLADEQAFFDALAVMETLQPDGDRNLVLTGPDDRSMEFVADRTDTLTTCKTCPKAE